MTGAPPTMPQCKEAVTGAPGIGCTAGLDLVGCGFRNDRLTKDGETTELTKMFMAMGDDSAKPTQNGEVSRPRGNEL